MQTWTTIRSAGESGLSWIAYGCLEDLGHAPPLYFSQRWGWGHGGREGLANPHTKTVDVASLGCRYQSATLGSFQSTELIETFINYHETLKKTVCLIFDPQRSQRGSLAIKAIRLKESFIEQYKGQKLTGKELREANISWKDVFAEVPIKIRNSSLVQALIADLVPDNAATQGDSDRLNLSMAPFLEKNLQSLMESVDDLMTEQQKVTMYHKNVARQAQQLAVWLQKRRQENQTRRAAGTRIACMRRICQACSPAPHPSPTSATKNINNICLQGKSLCQKRTPRCSSPYRSPHCWTVTW